MTAPTTLTFLFTDIEGSTRLWEQQPEAMRLALERHNAIVRQAIEQRGGRVFRTVGDAFCAAFPAASAAAAAAAAAQRDLFAEGWPTDSPLRVRIALHTGQAEEQQGDYVGASLNLIGRLLAVCHGGQILLTLVTGQLVRDQLPAGTALLDLGLHRFRDLTHPEQVFQLTVEGLPERFPPLASLDAFPNNLPVQLTSFIGRDRALAEVKRLLVASRLLTLTGPGGTGKTRLALQAAADLLESFPDGCWFVDLSSLANPELVVHSIAAVLSVREQPHRPLKGVLVEALRLKTLLIILDNCEHLIDACARAVDDLLRGCPQLKILTSSRELLGIAGEVVYRVPSLSVPEAGEPLSAEALETSEAVRLFVERARAIQPSFALTAENAPAVANICRRLDGIPLAIELAAARVELFPPEQIAARLNNRFRLLTGGSRTALPRQQTLEALFAWSYDLLSEAERTFFQELAVFAGGWTLEAAEAVCGHGPELEEEFVPDLLSRLINKSLVVADGQGETRRYRMLETTRQFALKRLLESGRAAELFERHMLYYAGIIQQGEVSYFFLNPDWINYWVHILKPEADNLRAAQEWALENHLEKAILFAARIGFYWGIYGFGEVARRYVREVIQKVQAEPQYQAALDSGQRVKLAMLWLSDGLLSLYLGQNNSALEMSLKGVEQARLSNDLNTLAIALLIQAEAAGLSGNIPMAYEKGEEAVNAARQTGDRWILANALINTATFSLLPAGDFQRARQYAEEGVELVKDLKSPWILAMSKVIMGIFYVQEQDYPRADEAYSESFSVLQAFNDPYFVNVARSGMADVARFQRQDERAVSLYLETIDAWRMIGNTGAVARCLECIAFVKLRRAQDFAPGERGPRLLQAARLLGAAERLREANETWMNPAEVVEYDRELETLQEMQGQEPGLDRAPEAAWAEGRAMDLDQVIAWLKGMAGARGPEGVDSSAAKEGTP